MSADSESFLYRWSRRKRAAEQDANTVPPAEIATPPAPTATAGAADAATAAVGPGSPRASAAEAAAVPVAALPSIESLDGLRSDYRAFFQQPVDDDLRRAALKKLFADPHFNQMDMLDVYVDDYTQFEPLPAAMRLRLPSAREFLLDSERAALDAAEARTGEGGEAPAASDSVAGREVDAIPSPDTGGEQRSLASEGTDVDSSSLPTTTPNAAPALASTAGEPAGATVASLQPPAVVPQAKATTPDSSSS